MHSALSPRHRAGLTLIDLMVTMAILGVLMAVLASGTMRALERANVSLSRISINQAKGGVVMYRAERRRLPGELDEAAGYMPDGRIPKDGWQRDLLYDQPATDGESDYEIRSLGRDGTLGGESFDADLSSLQPEE